MESDYLLGVSDETRLGALRFRRADGDAFLAKTSRGVPALVDLGRLLQSTDRILRDEETDEDLQLIFAPGFRERRSRLIDETLSTWIDPADDLSDKQIFL
jgi:hypothetical protein